MDFSFSNAKNSPDDAVGKNGFGRLALEFGVSILHLQLFLFLFSH